MIELIAIYAQQERANDDLLKGFQRFLKELEGIRTLVITIGVTNLHPKLGAFLSKHTPDGQSVILDPSNPFSNLARNLKPIHLDTLEFQQLRCEYWRVWKSGGFGGPKLILQVVSFAKRLLTTLKSPDDLEVKFQITSTIYSFTFRLYF